MAVISIRTHHDDLLGVVAPLAVASAHDTCLVVDLDSEGIPLPSGRTFAELVADGPTRDELTPRRRGIATLGFGSFDAPGAAEVLSALIRAWPAVVLRVGRLGAPPEPSVEVVPSLVPTDLWGDRALWVGAHRASSARVAAAPPRAAFHAVFGGRAPRGRWLRSWHRALEAEWRL